MHAETVPAPWKLPDQDRFAGPFTRRLLATGHMGCQSCGVKFESLGLRQARTGQTSPRAGLASCCVPSCSGCDLPISLFPNVDCQHDPGGYGNPGIAIGTAESARALGSPQSHCAHADPHTHDRPDMVPQNWPRSLIVSNARRSSRRSPCQRRSGWLAERS
jgi:hypothetical protein